MSSMKDGSLNKCIHLKSLKYLRLSELNNINDLSELAKLENLEELYIHSVPVQDISWMRYLKGLKKLVINKLKINSLDAISELNGLTELTIRNSSVRDLDPISHLKNLNKIVITNVLAKPSIKGYMTKEVAVISDISPDFSEVFEYIDQMTSLESVEKSSIKTELEEIQTALRNGKQTSVLMRRFRNVHQISTQVADVILEFLKNPAFDNDANIREIVKTLDKINKH